MFSKSWAPWVSGGDVDRGTLRIREGVRGPAGEPGLLLIAPPNEKLDWDVENEVASTARCWMSEHQAWWIAAPYRTTADQIVDRFCGPREPGWARVTRRLAPQLGAWFRRASALGYPVSTPSENR
jgi:hypothetical protein